MVEPSEARPFLEQRLQPYYGRRRLIVLVLMLAGMLSFLYLIKSSAVLPASSIVWSGLVELFSAAYQPAITYQSQSLIEPQTPLLIQVLKAMNFSLAVAAMSISVAILCSMPLAYVIVKESLQYSGSTNTSKRRNRHTKFILGICRILRATHELIWAVIFLIMFGFSTIVAIAAIAITATGVLTKLYSEILIETDTSVAEALRANGAPFAAQFIFGLLPVAIADLVAYTLYQLECAVRSSAVMGVLGLPTLGYFILQSHENLYFREVWTYIYGLAILMLALECWNKAVCKRLQVSG